MTEDTINFYNKTP